ncbi:YggS family pyridoxal phosphate-dependent enzyme [Pseudomarimonas arenosa]|uniref:Pyridoxal phosphate homeostasis protein n=1 Tax=Pseudomarimonas arenosa TaxID=2774145 RepID=A0AAW3ZK49_9GAMM|nr:YggS family pyridoxal phosphate-dependent enzyme [Pseudomarimonas arenosa]MBD8525579.1 YggS family pyridoxal phosphate-dependent enzyme [Pseudomarimonas arenosa]
MTEQPLQRIQSRITAAERGPKVTLVAVSKTRSALEVRDLAKQGQQVFGENYVQEALAKQTELADLRLEWHLIGHLQSNKCKEAAQAFDWVDTIDRAKLLASLDRYRDPSRPPLNLLIQVNVDDETSKSGCHPQQVPSLAEQIRHFPRLRLRGLMAIPAPADETSRIRAFERMHELFEQLRCAHPEIDTLSMGMSDDFELAIAHGATQVRVGTALFGPRPVAD